MFAFREIYDLDFSRYPSKKTNRRYQVGYNEIDGSDNAAFRTVCEIYDVLLAANITHYLNGGILLQEGLAEVHMALKIWEKKNETN